MLRGRTIVVNEFGCETLPIAVRFACPRARLVAIAHTHPGMTREAQHPVRRFVEALCCLCLSEVVFNSHALLECWACKVPRLPRVRHVVPYGIAVEPHSVPVDYPAKAPGCVDFVCVARFVEWKGHRELLAAWRVAICRPDAPAMRLVLVGDGPTRNAMVSLTRSLDLSQSVHFLGPKSNGAEYFIGGDVGILPSIEPEAFGLVLLEAMSRHRPVLASDLGGIPEVVANGETGILGNPHHTTDFAEKIVRLARDSDLRCKLGEAGFRRWQEFFTEARMLRNYRQILI